MVVTITGKNSHAVSEELARLLAKHRAEHGNNTIERFDGLKINTADELLDAVRSISFLEPKKLVLVHDFFQSKEILENLEEIINQTAESTDLVLLDEKLDKRSKVVTFLKEHTEFKDFEQLSLQHLEKWVIETVKSNGAEISAYDARFLIEVAGTDQLHLNSEIAKLTLYSKKITKVSIKSLIEPTPQSKIFTMLDELFRGNLKKAWSLYEDQRAQGMEPQQIIAMITWQLQQLALAVHSPQKTVDSLVNSGMSSFTARKSLDLARRIKKTDLRYYVKSLVETDYLIKTSANAGSALETFFSAVYNRQQGIKTAIS